MFAQPMKSFIIFLLIISFGYFDAFSKVYEAKLSNSKTHIKKQKKYFVVIGKKAQGQKKFTNKIVEYFSPTCPHCAEWTKGELEKIIGKLQNYNAKLIIKVLLTNNIDLRATIFSWSQGRKKVKNYYEKLLFNQSEWLEPSLKNQIDDKKSEKEQDRIIERIAQDVENFLKQISKGKTKQELDDIRSFLKPHEEDIYLRMFFIKNGVSVAELQNALLDYELAQGLITQSKKAKKNNGKPLDFIPAFYINNELKDQVITAKNLEKYMK
jgi:hypothetical protein